MDIMNLIGEDELSDAAFDPAPAVDNEFVAAAMKAEPSAFADLKPIPTDKRLP